MRLRAMWSGLFPCIPSVGEKPMNITIQFHGALRQLAGAKNTDLGLADSATVADAIQALGREYPHIAERLPATACAIGDALVARDELLFEGAELVLIPPVSGG